MLKKISKNTKSSFITCALVIVIYAVIQIMNSAGSLSSLIKGMLVLLCVYSMMAISLNLTVGVLGELSLGHAGFMCVGAFTSGLFTQMLKDGPMNPNLRFFLAILVGIVCAALFGFLIGIPVLRLKGDYLAIVTLGFGEIIKSIFNALYAFMDANGAFHLSFISPKATVADEAVISQYKIYIDGSQGITRNPRQSTFTIGIIMLLISLVIILNLMHSRTGRAVMAIRDNRIAAESVGIHITKYKLLAFTLSAAIAGAAGALYAHNTSSLMPTKFGYNMSIMFLVFVVLGGIGSMRGSIIAAIILTVLPELLRFLNTYRMLIYSIVLIVMMLWNWAPACKNFREKYSLKRFLRMKLTKKKTEEEV